MATFEVIFKKTLFQRKRVLFDVRKHLMLSLLGAVLLRQK